MTELTLTPADIAATPAVAGTIVTVEQVVAQFPKAKRLPVQPKVQDPALRAWAKFTAENLRSAGFSRKNVELVSGKREKLVSGEQTLTWFTKPEYAQAVMAYL